MTDSEEIRQEPSGYSAPSSEDSENGKYARFKKHYSHQEIASIYRSLLQRHSLEQLADQLKRPPSGLVAKLIKLNQKDPLTWRPYLLKPLRKTMRHAAYLQWKEKASPEKKKAHQEKNRSNALLHQDKRLDYAYEYYMKNGVNIRAARRASYQVHRNKERSAQYRYYWNNRETISSRLTERRQTLPYRLIGDFLKRRLKERSLTLGAVSKATGIYYESIRNHVSGMYSPRGKSLAAWTSFLDLTPGTLEGLIRECKERQQRAKVLGKVKSDGASEEKKKVPGQIRLPRTHKEP